MTLGMTRVAQAAVAEMSDAASSGRALVVIAERLAPECERWLGERCRVVRVYGEHGSPSGGRQRSDELGEAIGEAHGLVVRTSTRVDTALLDRAPRLVVVGRAGVGLDNIDRQACASRGVRVVHSPGANTRAVVEFVLAAMLDATRPRARVHHTMDRGEWESLREGQIASRELWGSTLGIVGYGRIGSEVGRAGAALGMRVVYHDVREIEPGHRHGAEPAGLEEVLGRSDVVSIHVDGRRSNRGLIGQREVGLLGRDAVLINTSRGFVVDADAVAGWLGTCREAVAVLDVHDPEPIGRGAALLGHGNAILTPHIAGATWRAKREMSWVVRDVWRVLNGECPEHEASPGETG